MLMQTDPRPAEHQATHPGRELPPARIRTARRINAWRLDRTTSGRRCAAWAGRQRLYGDPVGWRSRARSLGQGARRCRAWATRPMGTPRRRCTKWLMREHARALRELIEWTTP